MGAEQTEVCISDMSCAEADKLWQECEDSGDHNKVYEYLKAADQNDANIVWRLARACKDMSGMASFDKKTQQAFAYEGKDHALRAVELDPNIWQVQMFMGCLYGTCSNFEIMNKLGSAKQMKAHFEKAVELCADCPEPYHSLGQAEFGFADAGMAASMMGLKGNYQTAYDLFTKAESLCPHPCYERQGGHYNTNWLMLAKACKALKKKDEAKQWLDKVKGAAVNTPDDKRALEEANKLKI